MIELFDLIILAIVIPVQARITYLCWKRARGNRALQAAIVLFDALLVLGYVCSFSYLATRLNIAGRIASVAGAAALTYLITASGALVIHGLLAIARRVFGEPVDPSRRQTLKVLSAALTAAPFAAIGYGTFIERLNLHVREIDTPIANLPADLDGLRILQVSDIHLSPFLSVSDLIKVIDAARETNPHLAVVTGDLISSPGDPLDACIQQLARLRSDAGIFGCLGNHERYARAEDYTAAAAARSGIRFLRGEALPLRFGNATLNLAGVDHQSRRGGKQYLEGAESMITPGALNVLLSHNPDVFPVAHAQGYNLVLSGHTHGGQINIEILDQSLSPARFVTPFVHGLYRAGDSVVHVTRGVGTIGIPTRIGAPPEISVIHLRKA